jgi:hypothetical protein
MTRLVPPAPPNDVEPLPGLLSPSWMRDGRGVRWGLVALILSFTVFQRFGLTIGPISVNGSLLVMYALLAIAWTSGVLALSVGRLVFLLVLITAAGASTAVNMTFGESAEMSLPSLLMMIVTHLPLAAMFRPGPNLTIDLRWLQGVFANVAYACAIVGIVQFTAQFVIKAPWLFDVSVYIPPLLQSTGGYNVVIPVNDLFKSNGFFFKEPSLFSLLLAFGLLLEIATFKRWRRIGVMVVALLLTYSGTGLLILAFGLLFPLRVSTFVRLGAIVLVGTIAAAALWGVLNLGFTLNRLQEFSTPTASAYIRYVAPVRLIGDFITTEPWSFWLGFGPGSITRVGANPFYEFHHPTWAKALFEYGMVGLAALVSMALACLRDPRVPVQVRAATLFCWIGTGGFLLTPEIVYILLLFGGLMWAVPDRPVASHGEELAPPVNAGTDPPPAAADNPPARLA